MIALPVTVLGLAWSLSAILSRAWSGLKNTGQVVAAVFLGAVIRGSLRPINTWDLPTYLLLALLAAGYAIWRYGPQVKGADGKPRPAWRVAPAGMGGPGIFRVRAYQPFA